MFGLDQRGIAVVAVVVIIAASTGVSVATPVVVDIIDVDPDSPFYGLERLGERMRRVGDEDQMKERLGEYVRLVDRGKGLEYKRIMEEFVEKMHTVAPGDVATKQEIVQWMQNQMPEICRVQLKLYKEMLEKCKLEAPEHGEEFANEIKVLLDYEKRPTISPDLLVEIQGCLELIDEKVKDLLGEKLPRLAPYFEIDSVLIDVNIKVSVEVKISIERPTDLAAEFEEELDEFNEELAEIELEIYLGEPLENTRGLHALKRLIEVAKAHKGRAETAFRAGKLREALGLIHAAKMNLEQAEEILEHATAWEAEHREVWERHFKQLKEIREKYGENLEELLKNEKLRAMESAKISLKEKIAEAKEDYAEDWKSFAAGLSETLTEGDLAAAISEEPYCIEWLESIEYPVSGKISDNRFEATIAVDISIAIDEIAKCDVRVDGTITGDISGSELSAALEGSASAQIEVLVPHAKISIDSSVTLSGSVTGTFTDGFLRADVKGQGSATKSGKISFDFGSITFNCERNFEFEGVLLGEVTGSEFKGTMYLWITSSEVVSLSCEIEIKVPTQPEIKVPTQPENQAGK
jgi:tetratricopeptide (TPR) repeat protein